MRASGKDSSTSCKEDWLVVKAEAPGSSSETADRRAKRKRHAMQDGFIHDVAPIATALQMNSSLSPKIRHEIFYSLR
jgi:hypothetical protein